MASTDALIVHLPAEMLNDALWHLGRASEFEHLSDPFPLWREVRSAVIFSVTAVEAFMNIVATDYVRRNPEAHPVILDFLEEKESFLNRGEVRTRFRFVNLETKLSDWTKIITGSEFDKSDSIWQKFVRVKKFRNALVHYQPESAEIYNKGTVDMARDAVESAKEIILRYHQCSGTNSPPWLENIGSDL